MDSHVEVEHRCFTIHTPTFITQHRSCHTTSWASVWSIVSVPPHRMLSSVVWFIAEGAMNVRDLPEQSLEKTAQGVTSS